MRFDRERWYSSENRKAIRQRAYQESSGTRRIISLVFLLAMIIVAMQQLNDPSKYEPAFRSIGLAPSTIERAQEDQKVSFKSSHPQENSLPDQSKMAMLADRWQTLAVAASNSQVDTFAQMWEVLLKNASPEVINEIGERFFVNQRSSSLIPTTKQSSDTGSAQDRDFRNQGDDDRPELANQPPVEQSDRPSNSLSDDPSFADIGRLEPVSNAARFWLQQCSERVSRWSEDAKEEDAKEMAEWKQAKSSPERVSEGKKSSEAKSEFREFEVQRPSPQEYSAPDSLDNLERVVADRNEQLETFQTQWTAWAALSEGGVVSAAAALSNDMREGLRIAIDRRFLDQIRDGSPWRPTERPALLRTFQRAMSVGEYSSLGNAVDEAKLNDEMQNVPRVEVPQLTKQGIEMRGRLVRMRGRPISNATASEAKSERWGDFLYDVVWIYPDDNSQQPVCLYALKSWSLWPRLFNEPKGPTSTPPGGWPIISSERVGKTNANMESVEVTGFFLKRLAYASPRGVDVAPIMVVCSARWVDDSIRSGVDPAVSPNALSKGENRTETNYLYAISFLSKSGAAISRWREPGVYRNQLRLLNEVLAESLHSVSPAALLEMLRSTVGVLPRTKSKDTLESSTVDLNGDSDSIVAAKSFESILQVLYQLPRLTNSIQAAIESSGRVGPATLARIEGMAVNCITVPVRAPLSSALGKEVCYCLAIEPKASSSGVKESDSSNKGNSGTVKKIYAIVNRVPDFWLNESVSLNDVRTSNLRQPVVLDGLVLDAKFDMDATSSSEVSNETEVHDSAMVMLCDSPKWHWGSTDTLSLMSQNAITQLLPSIPMDWQHLAMAGWDLSSLRFITSQRGKPISSEEKEPFYSLMNAAEIISNTDDLPKVNTITPMECLKNGDENQLARVASKIRIVRITKIDVPEENNRTNLMGSEYYELDGLADIGRQVIQLKSPKGDGDIRFVGQFPMTLIAKSVPDWLLVSNTESAPSNENSNSERASEQSLQQGIWYPAINIGIEGVFYRLWSFSTGQTTQASEKIAGPEIRQIGPLVAVTKWNRLSERFSTASTPKRSFSREVFTAIAIALGILWFAYRFRTKQRTSKRIRDRRSTLTP